MASDVVFLKLRGPEGVLRALLAEHPAEVQGFARDGDVVSFFAYFPRTVAESLKTRVGFVVETVLDPLDDGESAIDQVGRGNRFMKGEFPKGIGFVGFQRRH